MHHIDGLYMMETENRGRGIFTARPIPAGSVIEVCPVLLIPKSELPIVHKTVLHDYYFLWGEDLSQAVIALGYGSLYNHELHPNATFILDIPNLTIDIEAIKDIEAGSEITINYMGESGAEGDLWF